MKLKNLYTAIIVMSLLAVGTRPTLGITYSIPTDTSIGTWDGVDRIYTLNTDLDDEMIEIVQDDLTLDGNGHTLTGTYEYGDGPHGVYLLNRTGVTIKNLNIQNFKIGIRLEYSDYNVLTDITASNNWMSISLVNSNHNTVTGSAVSNNPYGFYVAYSDHNTVTGNTFWNNGGPMRFYYGSCSNTLTNNSFSNNASGISVTDGSNYTTLTGNTVNSNGDHGIFIQNSSNNTVIGNTITNNWKGIRARYSHSITLTTNIVSNNRYGLHLQFCNDNQIYNNNFVDNETQAHVYLGSNNVFNLSGPEGGNYWSDWTRPDKNGDGIVDSPYVFFGGQDDLPWAAPNGWDLRITRERLQLLIEQVAALNLPKGFVGKLNDAAKVLSDANPKNNSAAVSKLNDFIDQVNNNVDKILDAEGDPAALIAEAEAIIAMLEAG